MPYWDSRVAEIAKQYEDIEVESFHIDILTANFVLMPEHFDIVVGSNLFGDILSDLGPACTGTIAIAPSANLNTGTQHAVYCLNPFTVRRPTLQAGESPIPLAQFGREH